MSGIYKLKIEFFSGQTLSAFRKRQTNRSEKLYFRHYDLLEPVELNIRSTDKHSSRTSNNEKFECHSGQGRLIREKGFA